MGPTSRPSQGIAQFRSFDCVAASLMFQEFYKHLSDPEDSDPEDTAFHGGDLMAFMVSMRQKSIVPNVAEVACYETGTKLRKLIDRRRKLGQLVLLRNPNNV